MSRLVTAFPSTEVEAVQALQRGLSSHGDTVPVSTEYNSNSPEQVLLFVVNESNTNQVKTSHISITVRIKNGDRDRGDELIQRLEIISQMMGEYSSTIKASAFTEIPQRIPHEASTETTYSGTLRLTIVGTAKRIQA